MASTAADSSSKPNIPLEEITEKGYGSLISKIRQLKIEIEADRERGVKEKVYKNREKLRSHTQELLSTACNANSSVENNSTDVPQLGTESALCVLGGFIPGSEGEDIANIDDAITSNLPTLPKSQRIPRYTTWTFLDRNRRMAEDESVVGRRLINFDQSGKEILICSDSEDDLDEAVEEKHEFSDGEDRILWMAFREHGSNEDVANVVRHFIGGTSSEILERYNELKLKLEALHAQGSTEITVLLGKSLSASLGSFDDLFCRRCLVFDCRLHGCAQALVYPSEKPLVKPASEDKRPCGDKCYLMAIQIYNPVERSDVSPLQQMEGVIIGGDNSGPRVFGSNFGTGNNNAVKVCGVQPVAVGPTIGALSTTTDLSIDRHSLVGKRKIFNGSGERLKSTDSIEGSFDKKQKKIQAEEAISIFEVRRKGLLCSSEWKPLEKDLYAKGLEIFGRNSCLIARNLLSGLKTCTEVFNYMCDNGAVRTPEKDKQLCLEDPARTDACFTEENILLRPRYRQFRKGGRTWRLKYSLQSDGHPSSWKGNGDEKQALKRYSPCTCQSMCGKDCSCSKSGTCCEKYCGCPRSCKNRFRGCHCAKGQCKSRQCPCFAANRECDPDVCRNCWVSCGGGSLGEPLKKGDGQCGNMQILLRQHKRVLLGRSDVAGWGAFIQNTVNKNEYLGEYTGEMISHREADERGKNYDHQANSSFLFDLNDQYVLDACREGNKLKFANHSPNPNCHCKIMLVAGDHRIGIFSKERIEAQEELFYDYRYGPDLAPAWCQKPESSKRNNSSASQKRARKHQTR